MLPKPLKVLCRRAQPLCHKLNMRTASYRCDFAAKNDLSLYQWMIFTDRLSEFAENVFDQVCRKRANLPAKLFLDQNVKRSEREEPMKSIKNIIGSVAFITGLFALAAPASAAWNYHGSELSRDRRELADARQELRHDLRSGADRHEIASDRAAIAREQREIWGDRRDWRNDHWYRDYYSRPWYRR